MTVDDPEQLSRLFAERASAGDLEGLLDLYEEGATYVAPDGTSASGRDGIRERLRELLAIAPRIAPTGSRSVLAGDVVLMRSSWRMTIDAADRELPPLDGASTEVARRQRDGGWRYLIDSPEVVGGSER